MSENKGISVILCCFNSSKRLPETIKHLAKQNVSKKIQWEIIIVNNNSSDNTKEIAQAEWTKYKSKTSFRIIDQPIPGLSNAREAGILEANFSYSCFCDDDNWLEENYIQTAFSIMENNPQIGMLGGKGEAVCEIEPPDWFEEKQASYAIGRQAEKSGELTLGSFLWGAGVILRTGILVNIYNRKVKPFLTDRKGNNLSAGGDNEICAWFVIVGYKLWYDDRLKFQHFIPKERLTDNYVEKLVLGFQSGRPIIQDYRHYISFIKNKSIFKRSIILLKALIKILLAKLNFKRYKYKYLYYLQDIQLCSNSFIIFDKNFAELQKKMKYISKINS